MSQVWRVIAPERKEATGLLGKLLEALLSGSAAGIVPLLASILNENSHENVEVLPGENVEDEEDDFECTKRTRTNGLPQNHSSKAARIEHHDIQNMFGIDVRTRRRSLYQLPSEIHHLIFAGLPDVQDVLCLSLANRYFWAVGLLHIEDHIVGSLAPWAGERIVCISDHSDPKEFPLSILNEPEQADVAELNQIYDLQSFSIKNTWKKVGGPSLSQRLQKWFEDYEVKHPMSEADRTEVMTGLKPEILEFYPRDQEWVLRNLTVQEYVRGGVIALKEGFIHGPQIDVLGFAEVLILRIAWSSEPVHSGRSGNLARGKWAGHRFDITPLAIHEEREDKNEWKDVSDEVFREIDVIFSAQKGDDWREQLTRQHLVTTVPIFMGYS
ncbi:hypothetical protein N7492_010022 [Penicillium capsulatum]|uniref:Uncharacterized protein n=1 Tax=Penicillium capsulatum TaxID=69766 RepID=A0A9W9HLP0_9EURO|nr:hypothetical protein N7492_010022 [Penicillium capsulatum]